MSKLSKLLDAYRKHMYLPWEQGVASIQRVIFAVYDKVDELKLRIHVPEFEQATHAAKKSWLLIDITESFADWMLADEDKDAYFQQPDNLMGYPTGELEEFMEWLIERVLARITAEANEDTVIALLGVGTLFGIGRVSLLVEKIKDQVDGRLLVFFPGEYHADTHTYRLLDARDGWNYLAVPLQAAI